MEEIVGLLIIVAVYIFKAVSKKLENSGAPDQPQTEKDFKSILQEVFQVDAMLEEQPDNKPSQSVDEVQPALARPVPVQPTVSKPVAKTPASARPAVVKPSVSKPSVSRPRKEEKDKPKEKIDPKKLIIYSEIMTPKCMSNN